MVCVCNQYSIRTIHIGSYGAFTIGQEDRDPSRIGSPDFEHVIGTRKPIPYRSATSCGYPVDCVSDKRFIIRRIKQSQPDINPGIACKRYHTHLRIRGEVIHKDLCRSLCIGHRLLGISSKKFHAAGPVEHERNIKRGSRVVIRIHATGPVERKHSMCGKPCSCDVALPCDGCGHVDDPTHLDRIRLDCCYN